MTNEANSLRQWLTYSIISVMVGLILGYSLGWMCFFLSLSFVGYGDSGPSWVNTVSDWVLLASLLAGIVGGQVLFFYKHNE
jgi:hypothetical protein